MHGRQLVRNGFVCALVIGVSLACVRTSPVAGENDGTRASSEITQTDIAAASAAFDRYMQSVIDDDAEKAYAISSECVTKALTFTEFSQAFRKFWGDTERLGVAGIHGTKLRAEGLLKAHVEYRLRVLKGRKSGAECTSLQLLYAKLENGEWKIIDPKMLKAKTLSYDEDPARIAEEFVLEWARYTARSVPVLSTTDAVKTYDSSGDASKLPLPDWKSAELKRLSAYGELSYALMGEMIGRTDSEAHLRSGFYLMQLDGSVLQAPYDMWIAKTASPSAGAWRLLAIKPMPIEQCSDVLWKQRMSKIVETEKEALLAAVEAGLRELVSRKNERETASLLSGRKLLSFSVSRVRAMKHYMQPSPDKSAEVEAILHFDKDRSPTLVSGANIIKLKSSEDGTWTISRIVPAGK